MTNDLVIIDPDDQPETGSEVELHSELTIDEQIAAKQAQINEALAVARHAVTAAQSDTSMALTLTNEAEVTAVKQRMVEIQKRAKNARAVLKQHQKEMEALQKQQAREMERVLNETLVPLQAMVERMQEGIWSVNLYLGTRESIVQLTEGAPAAADEPVHIRQRVLAMDEETMIAAEAGGIGYYDVAAFDEWICASKENLDQIIPETRGIVALVSRWSDRKTGQRSTQENDADRWTYFLIRNGANLYRVQVDEFKAGRHLIPPVDEFVKYFYTTDRETGERVELEPGTDNWARAEKASDALQRHYMRIALVLQGLADRTAVLHPVPADGLSFVRESDYLTGKIVAITDDERVLTTGQESFRQWQRRLLSSMRPGMRIIGAFDSISWKDENHERRDEEGYLEVEPRKNPKKASDPVTSEIYVIDSVTGDDGFKFMYERTDKVEKIVGYHHRKGDTHPKTFDKDANPAGHRYEYTHDSPIREKVAPATRASCIVYSWDDFILPLDLASVEDMQRFLEIRSDRAEYVDMLPLIRAAIKAKQAEAEAEAPMRQLIVGALMSENGLDYEAAQEQVDDLITWYKYTNRIHRSLADDEKGAIEAILTEQKRSAKAAKADAKVVELILDVHRDALLVARKRDGRYVVLTPQNEERVFTTMREFGKRTGFSDPVEWYIPNQRSLSAWDVAFESDTWRAWDRSARPGQRLTGPERDAFVAEVETRAKNMGYRVLGVSYTERITPAKSRCYFSVWAVKGQHAYDAAHPLTGTHTEAEVKELIFSWKRKRGVAALAERAKVDSTTSDLTHWTGSYNDGLNIPLWDDYKETVSLKQHPAEIKALMDARADYKAKYEAGSFAQTRLREAIESVRVQWAEREWGKLRAKFLEEYLDLDLWEDHKKGVAAPQWPLRYDEKRDLHYQLTRLIEEGVDFDGITVEGVARVFEGCGFELEADRWGKLPRAMPESTLDIPVIDKAVHDRAKKLAAEADKDDDSDENSLDE